MDPRHRHNAGKVILEFEEHVSPRIPSFRRAVIHGDLNGLNIVLSDRLHTDDEYHVAGFIDFNDCSKTCIIFELGISLSHLMQENLNPVTCSNVVEFVGPLIRAYNSVIPLSPDELDSLYYLVLARCVLLAIQATRSLAAEPWNTYVTRNIHNTWKLVEYLLALSKEKVDKIWLKYISTST